MTGRVCTSAPRRGQGVRTKASSTLAWHVTGMAMQLRTAEKAGNATSPCPGHSREASYRPRLVAGPEEHLGGGGGRRSQLFFAQGRDEGLSANKGWNASHGAQLRALPWAEGLTREGCRALAKAHGRASLEDT